MEPQAEALKLVPETMAFVYRVLPLTIQDGILTVALSEAVDPKALEDLKNFLDLREIRYIIKPEEEIEEGIRNAYVDQGLPPWWPGLT
jgi:type IV pilus assembly protein PilB